MLNEYLQSGLKAAKGAYKSAKYQMEGLSEIEIKTRECTNSDPGGAHGKDLGVRRRATHRRGERRRSRAPDSLSIGLADAAAGMPSAADTVLSGGAPRVFALALSCRRLTHAAAADARDAGDAR